MNRPTVLVVDDEEAMLHMMHDTLQRLGYFPVTVQSAKAALSLLETTDQFDVLITDNTMVGMSGKDLIAEVGKMLPERQPVRMFLFTTTAQPLEEDLAKLAQLVVKPAGLAQWREILNGK